jgi:ubiquinone/menaquinone biosynthesis C-methylase UbiE
MQNEAALKEVRHGNADPAVAEGFGREWSTFRQSERDLVPEQRVRIFDDYFHIFPWAALPPDGGVGADVGCGSGRWATVLVSRVSHLHLVDASPAALAVARDNLSGVPNVSFHLASVDTLPFADGSLDFAYSLGVLHHVPDTDLAIKDVAQKLKPGAPLLIYLYYAFENRPEWYRGLWRISDAVRILVSRLPHPLRLVISQLIAAGIYWPLASLAGAVERLGGSPRTCPLSWYRKKSFYVMRTDAYDRFCTRLEKRFSKTDIEAMLVEAGFDGVRFSTRPPYWCAVGLKR